MIILLEYKVPLANLGPGVHVNVILTHTAHPLKQYCKREMGNFSIQVHTCPYE